MTDKLALERRLASYMLVNNLILKQDEHRSDHFIEFYQYRTKNTLLQARERMPEGGYMRDNCWERHKNPYYLGDILYYERDRSLKMCFESEIEFFLPEFYSVFISGIERMVKDHKKSFLSYEFRLLRRASKKVKNYFLKMG